MGYSFEFNCKPNKKRVDKDSEFYNEMKSFIERKT